MGFSTGRAGTPHSGPAPISAWASCACLLALLCEAPATDYYVAPDGNNASSGLSPTSAWQTITHALAETKAGDVIHVGAGEYREWIVVTNRVAIEGADEYQPLAQAFSRHTSRTVIRPPYALEGGALFDIRTNNVTISRLTINGDSDSNGVPDTSNGIYAPFRPISVDRCSIAGFCGYGIRHEGLYPPPAPGDTDALRSHFSRNRISNICHTNAGKATGIFLAHAPSTCEYNEISGITGISANAAIYAYSCAYSSNMTSPMLILGNEFSNCLVSVWANMHGACGEPICIASNASTSGLIGIRVTAAPGRAYVIGNHVSVAGLSPSSNATPARGIWIHADYAPWDETNLASATDHLVAGNTVSGEATNADGTIGMYFAYDTTTWANHNNGVRATVVSNRVDGFDMDVAIKSGTNGVSLWHDPLVEIRLSLNDFESAATYALFTTGMTSTVYAPSNWWGAYSAPGTNPAAPPAISTNVASAFWTLGRNLRDTDRDGVPDSMDDDDDGDGLSDTNEILSTFTSPDNADTDGDRARDGDEVAAGTSPTNAASFFGIVGFAMPASGSFSIVWSSVSNRHYSVWGSTNLPAGFFPMALSIPGTPPTNSFLHTNPPPSGMFSYRITVTN